MPSRMITLVNYPPSPKQKNLFCELTGFVRFPISSIITRQGCHLAIKTLIDGRAAGQQLLSLVLTRQVFAKEWNKDYSVKDYGTAKEMTVAALAKLCEIEIKAVTGKSAKVKIKQAAMVLGVDPGKPEPEDKAADAFDGIISVSRRGQIK